MFSKLRIGFILMVVLALSLSVVAADKYIIDPPHANIGFSVKHMVITNVKGKFTDFSVEFLFDKNNPEKSSLNATIQTASINTDNARRDAHLRSKAFFDAKQYPEITFVSDKIEKKGDGYLARGMLTIKGVSKEIVLPFKILGTIQDSRGNTRMGTEGGLTINRQDFGVKWSKTLDSGGMVAGNEVKIMIDAEFIKQ